jgi:hypothetical protein
MEGSGIAFRARVSAGYPESKVEKNGGFVCFFPGGWSGKVIMQAGWMLLRAQTERRRGFLAYR